VTLHGRDKHTFFRTVSTFSVDFGRLYNYFAVCDKRQIAPVGWHVPSVIEWNSLLNFIGGGSGAYSRMIDLDDRYWYFYNLDDTLYYKNESGISAIPGGTREKDGWFNNLREIAYFWTSTGISNNISAHMYVIAKTGEERRIEENIEGFSVRCIKD
jgi:uncharacterized protein (TIGR02145 family)